VWCVGKPPKNAASRPDLNCLQVLRPKAGIHATDLEVLAAGNARERPRNLVPQMARFAVVGVINTAVDLAVLNTLIAVSHRGRSGLLYSLFKAISFLVAVLNS